MTVLFLSGSPSPSSRSARLLDHAAAQLRTRGYATHRIAVRDLPADALLAARAEDAALAAALAEVARAQAIVLATPVYKAAYSGLLKSFLDLLPQDGLCGKLVLPLATGGSKAHLLALDYALRPVLAALGAHYVLGSIYGTDSEIGSGPDGALQLAADLEARIGEGVAQLHHALERSAHHARDAAILPYAPNPRATVAAARMCCPV